MFKRYGACLCVATLAILLPARSWAQSSYYVNDGSTSGDVYCNAAGSDTTGTGAIDTPYFTLTNLLRQIDLEPGDTVYIDTGSYAYDLRVDITSADAGSAAGYVTFQGSTNAGGTVITRSGSAPTAHPVDGNNKNWLIYCTGGYVTFRHLTLENPIATWTLCVQNNAGPVRGEFLTLPDSAQGGAICYAGGSGGKFFLEHCALKTTAAAWGQTMYVANSTFYNAGGTYTFYGRYFALTNNIIYKDGNNTYVYHTYQTALRADYNLFFLTNGAKMAFSPTTYNTLAEWQGYNSQDLNSLDSDPLFVDTANRDFHLKSTTGHYSNGVWFVDAVQSPAIDAGQPGWDYSNEEAPNGSRVNLGRYGNTREASKTSSTASIECGTFNTHARAADSQTLAWNASGGGWSGGDTVAIDISLDKGATWDNITNGVAYDAGSIIWDTTGYSPTIVALWRIAGEGGEAADTNDSVFTIGTGNYYVNDDSTSGDIYCSAVGNDTTGDGRTNFPFRTLAAVFDGRNLEPGDTVYMDTGAYTNTSVDITTSDQGSSSDWVTIQGSTNAGGTQLSRPSTSGSIIIFNGSYIRLRHLTASNPGGGWTFSDYVGNTLLEFVTISNSPSCAIRWNTGSGDIVLRNCLFLNNGTGVYNAWNAGSVRVINSTFYGNTRAAYQNTKIALTNCVIHVDGAGKYAYEDVTAAFTADYNVIFVTNSAKVAKAESTDYDTLANWQGYSGQDGNSLDSDPLFVNAAGGDFHLQSTEGHYSNGLWFADAAHSPAIDAGVPGWDYANEPDPNGSIVNCGRYGNTPEASKTSSGSSIECSTLNSHVRAADSQSLAWSAQGGGWSGGDTVAIDISLDNCATWTSFTSGVPHNAGSVTWDTTTWTPSIIARWRIAGEGGEAADTNNSIFTIGTGNYYVNDDSASGDIYTSALGNDTTGDGRTSNPFRTLAAVLASRDLEPGDTVYIDTGTYTNTAVTFTSSDEGDATDWVTIQGSTNTSGGKTRLQGNGSTIFTLTEGSEYVRLRYLTLDNPGSTDYIIKDSAGNFQGEFLDITNSSHGVIRHSTGTGSSIYRNCLFVGVPTAARSDWSRPVGLLNCTFYGNTQVWNDPGSGGCNVWFTNCIMFADGAGNRIYHSNGDGTPWSDLAADYNVMFVTNGAIVAESDTGTDYATLADWQGAYGQDANSVDGDPLFADAAGGDFHLKSTGGRYDNGSWTIDTVLSPAIDAGDTNFSSYANEPEPNGERINCGRYGNTREASRRYLPPPDGSLFMFY